MSFDASAFKSHFPLFQQTTNRDLVYLDNAATTQKPKAVIQAISGFYTHHNGNANRASHRLARQASAMLEQARQKTAEYFQAESAKNIVFTSGATASLNFLATSLCQNLQAGDEIILSQAEHHANLLPWQHQAAQKQLRLRFLPYDADISDLASLVTDKTRIISLCAASNVLGFRHQLEQLRPYFQQNNCTILVDGAQLVAHEKISLANLPCDFFVASAHKMYGPSGLGFIYGKTAALENLSPWQYGGEMVASASLSEHTLAPIPQRFEAGTSPLAAIAGFAACLTFLQQFDLCAMQQHINKLNRQLHSALQALPFIELISRVENNLGIATFIPNQSWALHASDVAVLLDENNIAVRCGKLCAEPLLHELKLDSVLRVSLAAYNTAADIDALIACLTKLYHESGTTQHHNLASLLASNNQQQRYRQLMQLGEQLEIKADIRQQDKQIHGCESPLWLAVEAQDNHFILHIDTDSRLLKGLAVLLLEQLSGQSAATIQAFDLNHFLQQLALERFINPSRQNGLLALVSSIKQQCSAP